MWKTLIEVGFFAAGFLLTQYFKLQDSIRVIVTSNFGGFLVVTGGSILFGKYPMATNVRDKSFAKYLGHFIIMILISVTGIFF